MICQKCRKNFNYAGNIRDSNVVCPHCKTKQKQCEECSNVLNIPEYEVKDLDGLCWNCYSKYIDKEM